jgi:hypothetical protein
MLGLFAVAGPINCHVPEDPPAAERLPMDIVLTCLKLEIALTVAVMGTSLAGYAR